MYSGCTGLSAASQGFWDFSLFRLLTGLGVGGVFSAAVSLVAEVMPERSRPFALGMLQALSAVGNMMAAAIGIGLGLMQLQGTVDSVWRIYFLIGLAPALLAIPIMLRLKEPEKWQAAAQEEEQEEATAGVAKHKLGSMKELFGDPVLRRNTIFGMLLAFSGVVGLWGIGFFSFDLIRSVFTKHFEAEGLSAQEIAGKLTIWTGIASLLQNGGAFLGIYAFTWITQHIGRKPAFAISFLAAMISTAVTFWTLNELWQIFVLIPIMGFCQLSLFGGYAIYFPELFPTRLRSTGTSFCYNVGRLVSALGPFALGLLTGVVFAGYPEPMRYAGVTMCSVFLIGLVRPALPARDQGQSPCRSDRRGSHRRPACGAGRRRFRCCRQEFVGCDHDFRFVGLVIPRLPPPIRARSPAGGSREAPPCRAWPSLPLAQRSRASRPRHPPAPGVPSGSTPAPSAIP